MGGILLPALGGALSTMILQPHGDLETTFSYRVALPSKSKEGAGMNRIKLECSAHKAVEMEEVGLINFLFDAKAAWGGTTT